MWTIYEYGLAGTFKSMGTRWRRPSATISAVWTVGQSRPGCYVAESRFEPLIRRPRLRLTWCSWRFPSDSVNWILPSSLALARHVTNYALSECCAGPQTKEVSQGSR
jgi:hypothetical protein